MDCKQAIGIAVHVTVCFCRIIEESGRRRQVMSLFSLLKSFFELAVRGMKQLPDIAGLGLG